VINLFHIMYTTQPVKSSTHDQYSIKTKVEVFNNASATIWVMFVLAIQKCTRSR